MSNNLIRGEVPHEIGDISEQLVETQLSFNRVSCALPASVLEWTSRGAFEEELYSDDRSKREWVEYQDDKEIKDGTYKESFKLDILTGNLFACPPFLNHGGESGNHSSSGGGGVVASLVDFFFSSSKPTSTIPSRSRSAH